MTNFPRASNGLIQSHQSDEEYEGEYADEEEYNDEEAEDDDRDWQAVDAEALNRFLELRLERQNDQLMQVF